MALEREGCIRRARGIKPTTPSKKMGNKALIESNEYHNNSANFPRISFLESPFNPCLAITRRSPRGNVSGRRRKYSRTTRLIAFRLYALSIFLGTIIPILLFSRGNQRKRKCRFARLLAFVARRRSKNSCFRGMALFNRNPMPAFKSSAFQNFAACGPCHFAPKPVRSGPTNSGWLIGSFHFSKRFPILLGRGR